MDRREQYKADEGQLKVTECRLFKRMETSFKGSNIDALYTFTSLYQQHFREDLKLFITLKHCKKPGMVTCLVL